MLTLGSGLAVTPIGVDLTGVPAALRTFENLGQAPLQHNKPKPRTACPSNFTVVCAPAGQSDSGSARPYVPNMITMPAVPPHMPTSLPEAPAVVAPPATTIDLPDMQVLWKRTVRKFAGEWGESLIAKVAGALRRRCAQAGGDLKIEQEDRDGIKYVIFTCLVKPYPMTTQVQQPVAPPVVAGGMVPVSVPPMVAQAFPTMAVQPTLPETSAAVTLPTNEEDSMSELGVLDLSGGPDEASVQQAKAKQRLQRQRKRMASVFTRTPQLAPAAAAMSMQNCRAGRNAALVMANRAMPNRAATCSQSKVLTQNIGVPSTTGASAGPGEIQAVYSPEAYAAQKGWVPGAGVSIDTAPTMGVRATVTDGGSGVSGYHMTFGDDEAGAQAIHIQADMPSPKMLAQQPVPSMMAQNPRTTVGAPAAAGSIAAGAGAGGKKKPTRGAQLLDEYARAKLMAATAKGWWLRRKWRTRMHELKKLINHLQGLVE